MTKGNGGGAHMPLDTSNAATPPRWLKETPSKRGCFDGPNTPVTPVDKDKFDVVTPDSQVRLITSRMSKLTAKNLIAQMASPR